MTQDAPFIVRLRRGEYVQAPRLRVMWREKRRTKRTRTIAGLQFNEVEHAGWDRSAVRISPASVRDVEQRVETPIRRADGRFGSRSDATIVDATAAGVKSAVRRIRPDDAALIDDIDGEIAALFQRVADLREERKQAVAFAWTRAHVVRLNEVQPNGDTIRIVEP